MSWSDFGQLAVVASVLVLVWQTHALKVQIARGELQSVYDRYLELTKIEIADSVLHKMFLYGKDFDRFSSLLPEELHYRALSLLIFDQFAMIFNMSRQPLRSRVGWWLVRRIHILGRWRWLRRFLDRHRTIWEINADYVVSVLTNPLLIKSWRDWGLGETWAGSEFYDLVEQTISNWEGSVESATGPEMAADGGHLGVEEGGGEDDE